MGRTAPFTCRLPYRRREAGRPPCEKAGSALFRVSAAHPSAEIRRSVQSAFAGGRPDVRVWFSDDEIVGLVVTG